MKFKKTKHNAIVLKIPIAICIILYTCIKKLLFIERKTEKKNKRF